MMNITSFVWIRVPGTLVANTGLFASGGGCTASTAAAAAVVLRLSVLRLLFAAYASMPSALKKERKLTSFEEPSKTTKLFAARR